MTAPQDITLRDVTVCHDGRPAVHHVSGVFEAGSSTALVGPNGAGKSSLLMALAGVMPLSTGRISKPAELSWLPQQSGSDRQFPLSVRELAAMGCWRRVGPWRRIRGEALERIDQALLTVGLQDMAARPVSDLSVGQFQRARFARAIVQDAPVILLDEPFNALDVRTTDALLAVIQAWQREGRTLIAALHDLDQVHAHFPRSLLLAREPMAWGPSSEVLSAAQLKRANLVAAQWHDQAAWCAQP
jgi:zinc/manganese transport system ATP-binding protein